MYRRITKTVQDRGKLVRLDEVLDSVTDPETDWYFSPFIYGEDALAYFEEHKGIKGYQGDVFTDMLYWDLDHADFSKVQNDALKLTDYLDRLGLSSCLEVFFSGNKGVHVMVHTQNQLKPTTVSALCYKIAKDAGVSVAGLDKTFDTTVYNVNRIFRIEYTKHPKSGLYKVGMTPHQLATMSEEQIREAAKVPQGAEYDLEVANIQPLIDEHLKTVEATKTENKVLSIADYVEEDGFNPMDCPPDKRRCIYVLENGRFGPGERENATIRLAAACKGQNLSREAAEDVIINALEKRQKLYDVNPYKIADIHRNLDQVYSAAWAGGTYSCKTDHFLAEKCDLGNGPCCEEKRSSKSNVMTVNGLIDTYKRYGNEALSEYPKTGLAWLDKNVRLRPRNYSILNGANGSGKTSIVIQIMENLNKQKMPHLFFSLDMADSSMFEKVGARYTSYDQEDIEKAFNLHYKDEKIQAEVIAALQKHLPYTYFDFSSSVDPTYMENTVYHVKEIQRVNIQMCIVDYAGRLGGEGDNGFSLATNNAKAANDIAKRGNVHYLYLSQIPRGEGDHTKPLHSSRVAKNSGDWEENATIVINCWRPFGDGLMDLDNYMHLYIAKNRSGPLGEQVYLWDGKRGALDEITEQEFIQYENLCEANNKAEPPKQFGGHGNSDRLISGDPERFERSDNGERESSNSQRSQNSGGRFESSSRGR